MHDIYYDPSELSPHEQAYVQYCSNIWQLHLIDDTYQISQLEPMRIPCFILVVRGILDFQKGNTIDDANATS